MKIFLSAFLLFTFVACNTPDKAPEELASKTDPQVALDFMNSYVKSCNELTNPEKWVAENKQLSNEFKAAYRKLMKEAWEHDPEFGLGFDPIFDAQDYPDIGYRIKSFDSKTGIVQLESSDNLGYHAKVRVKLIGNKTLVDGAGVIRMVAH